MEKDQNRQGSGSGSAEHQGRERSQQLNPKKDISPEEKKKIHDDTGDGQVSTTGIRDTGQLSGRDDYSGAPGDTMENEDTGHPTER